MTRTSTSACPTCGGAVLPDDRFCGSCGTAVGAGTGAARPASATAVGAQSVAGPHIGADTSPWAAVAARLQSATLGEFEIMTELGRGGMAAVYLARDLALNRRVAIKVMAPGLLLGPGMIERFRQEAVTVANLQHAHIVSIHAVRQLEDLHFFVMQFVPGRTLEGVLRDGGALPIPVVRAWLYQIGTALGYAHRRGVIHRDIKPGNILLNADGEAVVTDFGIAKVAESPSHTQTGTVVGTPVYMSPEQCYARELTGASDQYSLGVVAYEMLAGRPPFSGSSFALMRSHTDEAPPPISGARTDVPPAMEAALMRMLAKTPEERFPNLAEALVALGAGPVTDDALVPALQQLAAVTERLDQLADVLRTPASPVPKTRERSKPPTKSPTATSTAGVASTEALVVAIAPPPSELTPGATTALRATTRNASGQAVPGSQLVWTSSAPNVVAVDANGTLRAIAPGTATITARVGMAHDTVDVVIGPGHTISAAPAGAPSKPAGASAPTKDVRRGPWTWAVPLVAVAGVGLYIVVPKLKQPSSSAPAARSDSTAPVVTAPVVTPLPAPAVRDSATGAAPAAPNAAPDTTTTTAPATPSAVVARRIELTPAKPATLAPGETLALSASVRDATGAVIDGARLTWRSGNPRVATVNEAGVVRGVGPGAARITARSSAISAALTVTIVAPPSAAPTSSPVAEAPKATEPASVPRTTPAPNVPGATGKSEAELRAEVQAVVATYARAIETRDTALIRRVFPTTGNELMTRWQTTFDDARANIQMAGGAVDVIDAPKDVVGSQVQARARYTARFASRAARKDLSFPVAFTAVVQREGSGWRIVSIK